MSNVLDIKKMIMWGITLFATVAMLFIPIADSIPDTPMNELQVYLAITVCAIFLFAFNLLDNFIVAIILPVAYLLFKLSDVGTIFGVWTNTTIWMLLGSFLLGNALDRTGILNRLSYWLLIKANGSFIKLIWAYLLLGVIANYCVSSGGLILFCLLSVSLIKSFGFSKESNEAAILMVLAYFAGNSLPVCLSYGTQIDMYMNLGRQIIPDLSLGWLEYALYNIAFLPYMMLITFIMYKFLLKPTVGGLDLTDIKEKYYAMGPISLPEKKGIVIIILTLLALIFNKKLGIAVAWVFMIAGVICFLPGINLGDKKCIREVNYEMLFFIAGCLAIGTVGMKVGIAPIFIGFMKPLLGSSILQTSGVLWIFSYLANLIMTPLAAGAAFCPAVTQICVDMGINPVPIYLIMCNCFDNVLLPYESAPALMMFSFGFLRL